jgi:protocatechuate 3,4-dioxygenase beta subunit
MTIGNYLKRLESRSLIWTLSALIAWTLLGKPATGQVSGATLSGEISDNSGAVVPDALVTAQNLSNGSSRSATTNDAGFYVIPNLLPGSYNVKSRPRGSARYCKRGWC